MDLVDKMHRLHRDLERAEIPHAFGGALALAWCTGQARGTIDIDLNLFVDTVRMEDVLRALPGDMAADTSQRALLERNGQARLWWDTTPVDLFFNTTPFHESASRRVRVEQVGESLLPFLDCNDLAVFKAFVNRSKDWADLEAMAEAGTLDTERVRLILIDYLGRADGRMARLEALRQRPA